jgi:hypothetical protein
MKIAAATVLGLLSMGLSGCLMSIASYHPEDGFTLFYMEGAGSLCWDSLDFAVLGNEFGVTGLGGGELECAEGPALPPE